MGCEKTAEHQDEDLATFFGSDPNWSLEGNRLTLSNDSVEVGLQRDATPPDSLEASHTPSNWRAKSYEAAERRRPRLLQRLVGVAG